MKSSKKNAHILEYIADMLYNEGHKDLAIDYIKKIPDVERCIELLI